jgi:hypothetical protein
MPPGNAWLRRPTVPSYESCGLISVHSRPAVREQARHRFLRAVGCAELVAPGCRLRLAYADPPYPASLYRDHPAVRPTLRSWQQYLSVNTVRSNLDWFRKKTGARRRTELVRHAVAADIEPLALPPEGWPFPWPTDPALGGEWADRPTPGGLDWAVRPMAPSSGPGSCWVYCSAIEADCEPTRGGL